MVENLGFDTTEFIISPPDRLEPYSFSYCFRVVNKVVVEAITRVSMNWNWAAPSSVTRDVDFDSKKNDDFHWNEVFHIRAFNALPMPHKNTSKKSLLSTYTRKV